MCTTKCAPPPSTRVRLWIPALNVLLACIAFAGVTPVPAQGDTASPPKPARAQPEPASNDNDIARWLAGMPIENTSLQSFALVPTWKNHAREMTTAWNDSEIARHLKVRNWAPAALGEISTADSPVFYFFSGADFVYPHALFPKAKTYVLCAREPVGSQPNPARIAAGELSGALSNFRHSLTSLLDFSFFITTELRKDVGQRHIPGILPVLELIIVRDGARIIGVRQIRCDAAGTLSEDPKATGGTPGVRIRFRTGEQPEQTLYYFFGDISNGGLNTHGGVLKFCETLGRGRSLLKAASFLPHEGEFTRINQWLLDHSSAIVQDPSGIPFRKFPKDTWTLRFWGRNAQPIGLFKKYTQPDLNAAVEAAPSLRIPFGFGYQHEPANALLIVAERTPAN